MRNKGEKSRQRVVVNILLVIVRSSSINLQLFKETKPSYGIALRWFHMSTSWHCP